MNYIDYTILLIAGFFAIKGLFRGFIHEIFGLLGVVFALIVSTKYMSNAAVQIHALLDIPPAFSTTLGFLVIFFSGILLTQVVSHLLQKIVKYSLLGWLDKASGGVIGLLKGGIIVSLITIMLAAIPLTPHLLPGIERSKLFTPTTRFAPTLFDVVMTIVPRSKTFYSEIKESYDNLPGSHLGKQTKGFLKTFKSHEDRKDDNR